MINKGKPLYIFYSEGLEPYLKVSFSGKKVIVDHLGSNEHYKYNISKLKLLPAIGYTQNALESLLDNKYNEDDDNDEYDCYYDCDYAADDDEDTDDDDDDNNTDDDDDDEDSDDDSNDDDDSDDDDEEDDDWF